MMSETELDKTKDALIDALRKNEKLRAEKNAYLAEANDHVEYIRKELYVYDDRVDDLEYECTLRTKLEAENEQLRTERDGEMRTRIMLNSKLNKALSELAHIKPSWDDAPEWAKWLALDADAEWFWYETEPQANGVSDQWISRGAQFDAAELEDDLWLRTLERRPEDD